MQFDDRSFYGPQLFAFQGDERTYVGAQGTYCGRNGAGFAMICTSTDADSLWNYVQSDYSWETYSSMTALPPSGPNPEFYQFGFLGVWKAPSPTTTGFSCTTCAAAAAAAVPARTFDLVWANECSDFGYFRKIVPMTCP